MKLNFTVLKLANNFFFISNLSEWHFSCRRDYNEEWLKNYPLSPQEKKALLSFKEVIKKYGFKTGNKRKKYLGNIFYLHNGNQVWMKLKKTLFKSEYKIILNTFEIFSPRFEQAWKNLGAKERKRRIELIQSMLKLERNQKASCVLTNLFGTTISPTVEIVVLFAPLGEDSSAAGSATIGNNSLALELPALRLGSFESDISIGVLFHELVHVLFEQIGGLTLIRHAIKNLKLPIKLKPDCPMSTVEIISEMVASSFAPYGYLVREFCNKEFQKELFSAKNLELMKQSYGEFRRGSIKNPYRLMKYLVWKKYPSILKYINRLGVVNDLFVEKIAAFYKK